MNYSVNPRRTPKLFLEVRGVFIDQAQTKSISQIARETGYSRGKVRKILYGMELDSKIEPASIKVDKGLERALSKWGYEIKVVEK